MNKCPGCGRSTLAADGGLDMLSDESRSEADAFAARYRALRAAEGWVGEGGREDPDGGRSSLWQRRVRSVTEAVSILANEGTTGARLVVTDVGSGGGWAARLLPTADVLAIDLLGAQTPSALGVRGDMRKLPLRTESVDAALYAASLHYTPVAGAIPEAARVLKTGGLVIAVDSPIYPDSTARVEAVARAAAYYDKVGYPDLAAHYHPIEAAELRSVLDACGFRIERFDLGSEGRSRWNRLGSRSISSFLVARKTVSVSSSA